MITHVVEYLLSYNLCDRTSTFVSDIITSKNNALRIIYNIIFLKTMIIIIIVIIIIISTLYMIYYYLAIDTSTTKILN